MTAHLDVSSNLTTNKMYQFYQYFLQQIFPCTVTVNTHNYAVINMNAFLQETLNAHHSETLPMGG